MSLLSIIQDAASELKLPLPATVIGNAAEDTRQLLRMAQRACQDAISRGTWQALRTERLFLAAAGEVQNMVIAPSILVQGGTSGPILLEGFNPGGISSAIPADFGRMVPESFWDRTNDRLISGPVDAVRWQGLESYVLQGPARWFTRRGNALLINPGMVGGETMAFEYYSTAFCMSAVGAPQMRWTVDTDMPRLPAELITLGVVFLFLDAQGLPSNSARAAYEARLKTELANDKPRAGVLSVGDIFGQRRHSGGAPLPDMTGGSIAGFFG